MRLESFGEAASKLAAEKPDAVILVIGAAWCKRSAALRDHVVALCDGAYKDKLRFLYVDIDSEARVLRRQNVQVVPTTVLFAGTHEFRRFVGANPVGELCVGIDDTLIAAATARRRQPVAAQ